MPIIYALSTGRLRHYDEDDPELDDNEDASDREELAPRYRITYENMSIGSDDDGSQRPYYRFSPILPDERDDNGHGNNDSPKASKSAKSAARSSHAKGNTKTKTKTKTKDVTPPPDEHDDNMDVSDANAKGPKPKKPAARTGRPATSNARTTRAKAMANAPPQDDNNMDVDEDIEPEPPTKAKKLSGRAAVTEARTRVSVEISKPAGGKRKGAPSLPDTPRYVQCTITLRRLIPALANHRRARSQRPHLRRHHRLNLMKSTSLYSPQS